MIELEEVVGGFVVTSDDDSQDRSTAGAGIVFVKVAHAAVPLGNGHAIQVVGVADRLVQVYAVSDRIQTTYNMKTNTHLKIATDDEKINVRDLPAASLTLRCKVGVDCVETSMALSSNKSDRHFHGSRRQHPFSAQTQGVD